MSHLQATPPRALQPLPSALQDTDSELDTQHHLMATQGHNTWPTDYRAVLHGFQEINKNSSMHYAARGPNAALWLTLKNLSLKVKGYLEMRK